MAEEEPKSSGWAGHYLRLVYLVFFVVPLILQPPGSFWLWSANWSALLVFLWLYFRAQHATGLALAFVIGGTFGLGTALLAINTPGGVTFFVYAVSFLARVERPAVAGAWLVVLTAAAGAVLLWHGFIPMLGMTVIMLIVAGPRIYIAELQRKNRELRRSRDEVEQLAALAERERIGRDLHDLLGHTLSVIVLKAELAAKVAEADPERSVAEIRDVERISREALADVRAAISGYRARGLPGRARQRAPRAGGGRGRSVVGRGPGRADRRAGERPVAGAARGGHQRRAPCARQPVHDPAAARGRPHPARRGGRRRRRRTGRRDRPRRHAGAHRRARRRRRAPRPRRLASRRLHPGRRRGPAGSPGGCARRRGVMIRVLIAEDQAMVLGALAALLGAEPDIEVVAQAGDGRDALSQALDRRPDVVLTDIEMPRMTGLELAAELARRDRSIRVIVLTTFGRPGYLRRAQVAGAAGYLLKDAPSAALASAVRTVHAGGRAIDPDLAALAWTEPDPLTDRQRQVLRLAAEGRSGPEIAAALRLSEGTVRNYLSEAISRLGARNRVEAARLARSKGWL